MLAVPQPYTPPLGAEPLARFAAPFAAVTSVTAIAEPVTAESDPQPVPSAMRPFDLGGFEEDEASLASLLPPRLIALPPVLTAAPARPEAAAPLTPTPLAAPADEAEIANEGVAEEIYGSLLGVAPAAPIRTGYVRIEEPEAEHAATEPVVIFPGQMTRPIVPVSSEDAGSFRRFDAPASAGQGQPIAANQALSEVDSEEAQRALRSALANLQRMSGAA